MLRARRFDETIFLTENMMKGREARIALGVLAIFVFVASTVVAQRIDGDLRGVVKDPTGAVVPCLLRGVGR